MNETSVDNPKDPALWVIEEITRFADSAENTMKNEAGEPSWAEPLVGFSNGSDPIYLFLKKDVGAFYLTPLEIFAYAFPNESVTPDQLTVISWILPQTDATKADHRKESHFPSERWARSRIFGEEFNNKLRRHVVEFLGEAGIEAVAPLLSPLYGRRESKRYGFASTWSERHTAYAAGLGTFGLSDGLITPKGKAMRAGSVIARLSIPANPRPYNHHNAYCLFYSNGTCGDCISRCPIGAITEKGHDKVLCQKYVDMTRKYVSRHYGFQGYGCGLCQTGVPCESEIPRGI